MKNIEYVRPQDIEKRSFAIISKELEEKRNRSSKRAGACDEESHPYQCGF